MTIQANVLVAPVVSEKSVAIPGKYTFKVDTGATKHEVKAAVKEFYGVEVVDVNMVAVKQKTRVVGRGRTATKRATGKKAIVTLKKGQTLNFNDFK